MRPVSARVYSGADLIIPDLNRIENVPFILAGKGRNMNPSREILSRFGRAPFPGPESQIDIRDTKAKYGAF
jgi:hypothetical protein